MMPLVFGSKEANDILERDKRGRVFGPSSLVGHEATTLVDLRIAPTGEPRPQHDLANEDFADRSCTVCGGYMEFIDCWQCGGAGEFDAYEDDPLWFEPGDTEDCDVCRGAGGYWECASLPHEERVDNAQ